MLVLSHLLLGFILWRFSHLPVQVFWDSQRGDDTHGQKSWCCTHCVCCFRLPHFIIIINIVYFLWQKFTKIHLVISPQGQNMTLIHMAPQVPLPDRLYQGRVQLLEVKYTLVLLFELHCKTTQEGFSKIKHYWSYEWDSCQLWVCWNESQFLHIRSLSLWSFTWDLG